MMLQLKYKRRKPRVWKSKRPLRMPRRHQTQSRNPESSLKTSIERPAELSGQFTKAISKHRKRASLRAQPHAQMCQRSYWIWGFLAFLVVVNQLLGITEKLWIKVRLMLHYHLSGPQPCLAWFRHGAKLMEKVQMRQRNTHSDHSLHLSMRSR